MENGAVQSKALCRKHERRIGYGAVKDRLARGPQEASWTSNQIIIVISISRWDSTNNNIYEVISILSTQLLFPKSQLVGMATPVKIHLLRNIFLIFN